MLLKRTGLECGRQLLRFECFPKGLAQDHSLGLDRWGRTVSFRSHRRWVAPKIMAARFEVSPLEDETSEGYQAFGHPHHVAPLAGEIRDPGPGTPLPLQNPLRGRQPRPIR